MTSSISFLGSVHIIGNIYDGNENKNNENENISAIEVVDSRLIVGADEGSTIKVLKDDGEGYKVERTIPLNDSGEIDIEGIAYEDNTIYVIGSHSFKRDKIDPEQSYEDNRKAIKKIEPNQRRDQLFCLHLNGNSNIQETSLRSIIDSKKVLQLFSQIPSKENGVDIEGIAVHQGLLYIGFRGPVLRANWVPILKCKFAQPITQADLVFVNLGGRGIRDFTRIDNGFLILAGPVGDGSGSYQVYFWDGEDCLPGTRILGKVGRIELLGEIPVYENMKPEGLALVKETKSDYEVLIIFDGLKNGGLSRLKIRLNP